MNALLVVPPAIALFVYVATNWGEQRALKPGWRSAVIVLMLCLGAFLSWPLFNNFVLWAIPK